MSRGDRIVVIGAGHNGLAAAARLARAGRAVTVLEARDRVGGLAARESFGKGHAVPGLLHDTSGVRPEVVADLGLAAHGLQWRLDAADVFAPAAEGRSVWVRKERSDHAHVEGAFGGDADRYARFRAFIERVRPAVRRLIDRPAPDPLGSLWPLLPTGIAVRRLGRRDLYELMRIGPMCVADWMRDSFETERLGAAVAAPALEGSFYGPWAPGTAACLLLRECAAGAEVAGGPAKLVEALAAAARAAGAEIRTDARVERIAVDADGVRAVTLAGGETIEARVVAATCDPKTTFLRLIGEERLPERLAHRVRRIRARGTTAKVHLALSGPLQSREGETVEALRTGDTLDDLERGMDPAKYRALPEAPVLDVRVWSMSVAGLAPEGHHVVSILAHGAPHEIDGGWDEAKRDALGRAVVQTLARHCPSVTDRIVEREVLTPADIEARYGTTGGHVHHGEHAPDQLMFMRPTIECARHATPVPGLFVCGSGAHPGGGITCMPGWLGARALLDARR